MSRRIQVYQYRGIRPREGSHRVVVYDERREVAKRSVVIKPDDERNLALIAKRIRASVKTMAAKHAVPDDGIPDAWWRKAVES